MSRSSVAFPRSYQRHLVTEQRKAVLAALRDRIGPEHTVGEVLDAAEALGWAEPMGELSLADLAAALLTPIGGAASASRDADAHADTHDEDVDEDEADEEVVAQPAKRGAGGAKKATAKVTKAPVAKAAKKGAAKKASARAPEPARKKGPGKKADAKKGAKKAEPKKAEPKKSKKPPSKAPAVTTTSPGGKARPGVSKKTGKGRRAAPVDFDEPMSLEEAAGVLVPLVESLGEATMQDLEEQTAGGRRKLRFHIGQLVRHGHLQRHGMGRGTFYTVG